MQSHVVRNVRAELARRGKTQEDIAELFGFTRQAMSRRLLGRTDFRISELQAIAEYLEVPLSALVDDTTAATA